MKQQGQESAKFHRVPGHVKSVKQVSPTVSKKNQTGATPVLADTKLGPKEHTHFRGDAGLAQYMSDRRGDISFVTKEVLRAAAAPTNEDAESLKRIARYIQGVPRCVLDFPWLKDSSPDMTRATSVDHVVNQ